MIHGDGVLQHMKLSSMLNLGTQKKGNWYTEDPVSFYGNQTIISHRYLKMNNNPICYYSGGTSMYLNFRECVIYLTQF